MPKITKCPNCGASLDLDASLTTFFCPYCGTKISNVSGVVKIETVERHVDEAALEKAKLETKQYENQYRDLLIKIVFAAVIIAVAYFGMRAVVGLH